MNPTARAQKQQKTNLLHCVLKILSALSQGRGPKIISGSLSSPNGPPRINATGLEHCSSFERKKREVKKGLWQFSSATYGRWIHK
jgi:hypothetical protein